MSPLAEEKLLEMKSCFEKYADDISNIISSSYICGQMEDREYNECRNFRYLQQNLEDTVDQINKILYR